MPFLTGPTLTVATDDESAVPEGSSIPDETETDTKVPVDEEEDQPPSAEEDDTAAIRAADPPESPSREAKTWETVVQAATELLVEDTVVDEVAATGE